MEWKSLLYLIQTKTSKHIYMKLFDMLTNADKKRIKEDHGKLALTKRIEELDKSLSIALDINDQYQRENKELKEKIREAEGETSIVKAVGINSPEMRALQKEVEELKADLARAKEDHQYDNLVHQNELKSLRKK